MIDQLLEQGGWVMPWILITIIGGYLLAVERMLMWCYWWWGDKVLRNHKNHTKVSLCKYLSVCSGTSPLQTLLRAYAAQCSHLAGAKEGITESLTWSTQLQRMEARMVTIGWIGGMLPMLGLLGTVSGMIATFQELAITTSRQLLSQGLSEAMLTTQVGLLGAIPILTIHHVLLRLRERWLAHAEQLGWLLIEED